LLQISHFLRFIIAIVFSIELIALFIDSLAIYSPHIFIDIDSHFRQITPRHFQFRQPPATPFSAAELFAALLPPDYCQIASL